MARTVLTYADYEALPNDGQHYQILDGKLFVTATPNTSHQMAVGNLFATLRAHVRRRRARVVFVSPTTVILANTTVVEPDIVFVGADRLDLISKRGIEGTPTLPSKFCRQARRVSTDPRSSSSTLGTAYRITGSSTPTGERFRRTRWPERSTAPARWLPAMTLSRCRRSMTS